MTSAIQDFKQEAVRLFDREIHDRWKESGNVWRNAWGLRQSFVGAPPGDRDDPIYTE